MSDENVKARLSTPPPTEPREMIAVKRGRLADGRPAIAIYFTDGRPPAILSPVTAIKVAKSIIRAARGK